MPDFRSWLLALIAMTAAFPLHAEDEATSVKSNLSDTMKAMQTAAQENAALAAKEASLREELQSIQGDLVGIAGKIQQQEKALSELETGLHELEEEEKFISGDLSSRQKELSRMLQSMMKLSYVPPEMVIAMPGDFSKTLRTAKILGLTSDALGKEATQIRAKLEETRNLERMIRENHKLISSHKQSLEEDQKTIASKLDTRGAIQNQLSSRRKAQDRQLADLSAKSSTLKDLLSKLEARHAAEEARVGSLARVPTFKPSGSSARSKPPVSGSDSRQQGRAFVASKGKIPLPAEGKITRFYGDKIDDGDISRGITIKTREKAQVISPSDGEVVYTGPFLEYGNLVIIRHADDYHTLLAGLERISCQPGQQLVKGEPVGSMGQTVKATALYMEIRKDNRPTDPSPWLGTNTYANRKLIR